MGAGPEIANPVEVLLSSTLIPPDKTSMLPDADGFRALDQDELLRRYHEHGDADARRLLIESMLPLVRTLARRYVNRGESLEDLFQVGCVGLIKAVDRFDVSRDLRFSTFAVPTILGEIKRHFRDRAWSVRVSRGI